VAIEQIFHETAKMFIIVLFRGLCRFSSKFRLFFIAFACKEVEIRFVLLVRSIRTPMLIQGRHERMENLMQLKWQVT